MVRLYYPELKQNCRVLYFCCIFRQFVYHPKKNMRFQQMLRTLVTYTRYDCTLVSFVACDGIAFVLLNSRTVRLPDCFIHLRLYVKEYRYIIYLIHVYYIYKNWIKSVLCFSGSIAIFCFIYLHLYLINNTNTKLFIKYVKLNLAIKQISILNEKLLILLIYYYI